MLGLTVTTAPAQEVIAIPEIVPASSDNAHTVFEILHHKAD
jgi:hypothetical protein